MTIKEAINACVAKREVSKAQIARKLGVTAQSFNDRINRGKSMTADNLIDILDALGYDLVVKDRINGSEEVLKK